MFFCLSFWFLVCTDELTLDPAQGALTFEGTLYPSHFNSAAGLADHHLIVWRGGKASDLALIQADPSDGDILKALERLGGRPGNNVSVAAWLRRNDPEATAPDEVVSGSLIEVTVSWSGSKPHLAGDLLVDEGGRGFEFRLGGHALQIPLWRSGCVVCLESCPGGRISNARYTMHHLAQGLARFQPTSLPPDGTRVQIRLRLLPEPRP